MSWLPWWRLPAFAETKRRRCPSEKIRCFVTPDDDWLSGTAWRPMSRPRSRKWRSSVWRLFIVVSAPESQQVTTQNALHTRTKFKPWKKRVLRVYRVTCAVSGFLLIYRVKLSLTFLIKWRGAFMCDLSKAASQCVYCWQTQSPRKTPEFGGLSS